MAHWPGYNAGMAARFTRSMRRSAVTTVVAGAALAWTLAGSPDVATAQVDCEAIPAGPARTDCYIGLSRLFGQKSGIAAGVAKQQADAARLRQVTGAGARKTKKTRKKVRRKAAVR